MAIKPQLQRHIIVKCHRLGPKVDRRGDQQTRPIIVKFSNESIRDDVLRARFVLKEHNAKHSDSRIFLNEYLTGIRAKLAREARVLKKSGKIDDTWTFNGNVCQVFDDPDDVNWAYTRMITDVIDRHAPLKRKRRRAEEAPYMNSTYRKAIRLKIKLRSEFLKMKTPTNWELYRKQRNLCTSMRRQAVKTYFLERCERGPNNTDFWHTIKPFLTNKGYHDDGNDILLHDESKLVHDPELTSNIFNDYYVNITSQLGLNDLPETDACPSVLAINDRHNNLHMSFSFQPTTVEHVAEKLHQLNSKKATGFDHILAKLLKVSADILAPSLTAQINNNIATSCFPTELKTAQVIPVYKKKDPLDKAKYRPVSILPALSKIFERRLADQMTEFFNDIFSHSLSAFRKGISCQSILLKMMEDWRKALDDRKYVGAVLMDLSKAFDCMPHNLLLAKLQAYRPLSRRLNRCDRVIQNESRDPFGGNVYYVTCKVRSLRANSGIHHFTVPKCACSREVTS